MRKLLDVHIKYIVPSLSLSLPPPSLSSPPSFPSPPPLSLPTQSLSPTNGSSLLLLLWQLKVFHKHRRYGDGSRCASCLTLCRGRNLYRRLLSWCLSGRFRGRSFLQDQIDACMSHYTPTTDIVFMSSSSSAV